MIVEDHLMFREVIRLVCDDEPGIHVVGEAATGPEGMKLILETKPDIAIMDISLPGMDGLTVAERVLQRLPNLGILVLSSFCDDYTLYKVERLRVKGFVDKNSNSIAILKQALAAIREGRSYFSAVFHAVKKARLANPRSFDKMLSESEQTILSLIGHGHSDAEIARRLKISPLTAQTHRRNIMHKLGISGTPKLVAFAAEHGMARKLTG
ncbi:MAG TPA: response regulator transcription factor [Candidatus Limnocylindria bacterium]|nr:response regulator transcription factor [Candidatus Limnocylindria bacterium]